GSGEKLNQLAASDSHVRAVHLSRNFGHQAACQAGLSVARGHAVIVMDSDMQDAPQALPKFIEAWQAGADVVYAIRTQRKEFFLKRWLYVGFYRVLRAVSDTRMPLDAGAFGLVDRRVAEEIVALGERDRFLPGLRSWVGFKQQGVEVERLARYDDHPRISLRGLWRLAKTAIFSFSTFPLSVFYAIGYSALAVFICLSSYSLYCKLFTDLAIPGWTSHVLSASFFGALNALGISILGEYVVRIYDQVRGRPIFLIDRVVERETKQSRECPGSAELQSHD
ncbi:MAG: glycosyltransferase family 2 protein, partial [Pirellulales bacterium]